MVSPGNKKKKELPPRARRILLWLSKDYNSPGTTSACAENTLYTRRSAAPPGNYLRVRGEYHARLNRRRATSELPPRARRILEQALANIDLHGTTSACAENTS